jgi:hypothetical protein
MASVSTALAQVDSRPFFEKVLRYAIEQNVIAPELLKTLLADAPKGMVQIANYFGTAHLRTDLESARQRIVNLISLYLEDVSGGDLQRAALSLRDKSLLSHSKGGSDMIKRLHAMPDSKIIGGHSVTAEDQRNFLNDHSLASALSLADYRLAFEYRKACQQEIDFALWLAKKMNAPADQVNLCGDTSTLLRSAMLVLFAEKTELKMPTRSGFVRLIEATKKKSCKLDEARLKTFLANAPLEFQQLGQQEMQRFIADDLPEIRKAASTADSLLYGESSQPYFVVENMDEDNREYERLVAQEWHRVTKGDGDDPAVVSTVFLLIATGFAPKPKLLLREGQELIQAFRTTGFNSKAVLEFINIHAPHESREDLKRQWLEDLKPEAELDLADNDPSFPDSYMERSLEYLRKTCATSWKSRRR